MYGPLHHVYLSAHGTWSSTSWLGEVAQIGLRLPFASRTAGPAKGAIWTPLANGDVTADTGSTSGTNGQLSRTWTSRIGPIGSLDNFDDAAQVNAAEDVWTFLNAIKAYTYSGFRWTHVKMAPVGIGGDFEAPASTYSFSSPLAGTGTSCAPPQVALACSLRAPVIGKRGRGRIYLPAVTASQIASDGTVATTMNSAVRTAFKTMIDALQAASLLSDYQPIVSVFSAGASDCIRPSEIRIGDRWDTQQRRRAQVPEAYAITTL